MQINVKIFFSYTFAIIANFTMKFCRNVIFLIFFLYSMTKIWTCAVAFAVKFANNKLQYVISYIQYYMPYP
jgi:hypothetical protein